MTDPFRLFWHRYGNTPQGVERVSRLAERPQQLAGRPVEQGLELDLKWTGESPVLYAYHGPSGRERLREAEVHRRAGRGEVVLLDDLFSRVGAEALHYLVELKCGHGDPARALVALQELVNSRELGQRVWLAASSLELLTLARQHCPELPRVLFGACWGKKRVFHKPTTYVMRSLRRHGVLPLAASGPANVICPLGLKPRTAGTHATLAEAARARGLGYLPGRVRPHSFEDLARAGHPGAFVYARPDDPS